MGNKDKIYRMEIAKRIYDTDYNKLQLLNLQNDDWLLAIGYLERRLNERYVEPIEILIDSEKEKTAIDKKFGFTILAIDCLLAETIQSFYEGRTESKGKSRMIFVRFLMERDGFKNHFPTINDAMKFYEDFRCGILHQGQTFGDTKIWTVGQLIQKQGEYIIVNREEFHEKIKQELNIYFTELRKRQNQALLNNFKKKMDFICNV
jgi:hypothetical protein